MIDYSAILLWFPVGKTPIEADFTLQDEDPRAEKFVFRHEAVIEAIDSAITGTRRPNRVPWLKYGEIILDEAGILAQYRRLRPS